MRAGHAQYATVLNAHGGVLDDAIVARIGGGGDGGAVRLVTNASRAEVLADLWRRGEAAWRVRAETVTDHALLALQGEAAAIGAH